MKDAPVGSETRALLTLAFLCLGALVYFGLPLILGGWPPAYVRVGPLEFGQLAETTCHGLRAAGEMVFEACK